MSTSIQQTSKAYLLLSSWAVFLYFSETAQKFVPSKIIFLPVVLPCSVVLLHSLITLKNDGRITMFFFLYVCHYLAKGA
jgi:predicted histidine transporter YuiF (NhaC family)